MNKKVDKHFVSEPDQFLEALRKQIPEHDKCRRERQKYEKIAKLRDNAQETVSDNQLWEEF